ncbi:MAG TPA: hypothetical protein VFX02_10695 [Gammaproteobacteria bacterium]|nr:hypothetical protein [Gammaproteobacteria bacterium]
MKALLSILLKLSASCLALCLLLSALPARAGRGDPWGTGAAVSVLSDDNVTRAAAGDAREDNAVQLRADAYYSFDFSLNHSLIVTGHVLDESYRDFDGISSLQAGLEAEYRFRTRRGFGAPVYSFYVSDTQADYETDNRDGATLEYGLRLRRQYTDRIALAAGAAHSERTAEGRVFDLEQARYYAQLDYAVPNLFQAYLAYHYIDGDVYSISPVTPAAYGGDPDFYEATELDPAFNGARPWWAYRLDARTDVLRLGFNMAFDGDNAIDIAVDNIGSETKNRPEYNSGTSGYSSGSDWYGSSLTYDATVITATYLHRF